MRGKITERWLAETKVHNLTKFDSRILQNRQNILQSWEILQKFEGAAGGGASLCFPQPCIQTSVKLPDFAKL